MLQFIVKIIRKIMAYLLPKEKTKEMLSMARIDKDELDEVIIHNQLYENKYKNKFTLINMFKNVVFFTILNIKISMRYNSLLTLLFLIISQINNTDEETAEINLLHYSNNSYMCLLSSIIIDGWWIDIMKISHKINRAIVKFDLLRNEWARDKKKYGSTWQDSKRMIGMNKISNYWKEHGLNNNEINYISINAEDPDRLRSEATEGFDLKDHIQTPGVFIDKAKDCDFARQDDYMHVMAIYKRLAGERENPTESGLNEMYNTALSDWVLPLKSIEYEKSIHKAISTKGTAGQWAKRTMIAENWKNLEDENCLNIWCEITPQFIYNVSHKLYRNKDFTNYSLYRKVEVLPLDIDGNVKITRLIQAASLPLRVADSLIFESFNDSMVKHRLIKYSDIGLRIERELPIFLNPFTDDKYIICDFSDFDGHQHPRHMSIGKICRMTSNLNSKQSYKDVLISHYYLRNKYDIHLNRTVVSSWGLTFKMYGTLASGDIVTSDDNTLKTATFLKMVEKRIRIFADQEKWCVNYKAVGDDVKIRIGSNADSNIVSQGILKVAKDVGYKLKECIIYKSYKQGGKCISLGHTVELVLVALDDEILTIPIIARPDDRLWTKFYKSAELSPQLTYKTKQIIASKMMSYIYMLWAMPEVELIALSVILRLGIDEFGEKEYDKPYTWRNINIDYTTITESLGLYLATGINNRTVKWINNANRMDEQQIACNYFIETVRHYGIEIDHEEIIAKNNYMKVNVFNIIEKIFSNKKIKVKRGNYGIADGMESYCTKIHACRHVKENITITTDNFDLHIYCNDCIKTWSRRNYAIIMGVWDGYHKACENQVIAEKLGEAPEIVV